MYESIRERIVKSIFECTQLHNFMNFMQRFGHVGPSSGIQCWTLYKTETQGVQHCMPKEGPTGPKRCIKS